MSDLIPNDYIKLLAQIKERIALPNTQHCVQSIKN